MRSQSENSLRPRRYIANTTTNTTTVMTITNIRRRASKRLYFHSLSILYGFITYTHLIVYKLCEKQHRRAMAYAKPRKMNIPLKYMRRTIRIKRSWVQNAACNVSPFVVRTSKWIERIARDTKINQSKERSANTLCLRSTIFVYCWPCHQAVALDSTVFFFSFRSF